MSKALPEGEVVEVEAPYDSRADLLGGPLVGALLRLAWPAALTAMLQGLVAAADVIMVGRLGEASVAAVTASRQALMVVLVAGSAAGAGASALVAQAVGRDDRDEANHVLTQAMLMFAGLILFGLMPVGWFLAPWLLDHLIDHDPEVLRQGVPYLQVVVCSLLFTVTGFACGGALRGAGDTKTLLKVTALTNVINVAANFCFIYGVPGLHVPAMGVVGAAWGTALARGIGTAILLVGLTNGRLVLRLQGPRRWKPDFVVLREILRIGVPTSVSAFSLNLFGVLVIGILARTTSGRLAVAAYGLSMTFRNLGTWMTWGLSEATLSMVGQNVGAGQMERADLAGRASAKVAFLFLLTLSGLMAAVSPFLLPLLLKEPDALTKARVVRIGVIFMTTQIAALPCLGVGMVIGSALRGSGDAVAPMMLNLVSLYLFGLPCAALLALPVVHLGWLSVPGLGWGHWGVWAGMAAGSFARGGLTYGWWRRGSWSATAAEPAA